MIQPSLLRRWKPWAICFVLAAAAGFAQEAPVPAAASKRPTLRNLLPDRFLPGNLLPGKKKKARAEVEALSAEPAPTPDSILPPAPARTDAELLEDGLERYPHLAGKRTFRSRSQREIDDLIDMIYENFGARIERMNPVDLSPRALEELEPIPADFQAAWRQGVTQPVWDQGALPQSIDNTYVRTLAYSNQVRVFSDLPLIRETGMQEARGAFNPEVFADGRVIDSDEPIGSELTTGRAGRFRQSETYFEAGVRKKFFPGTEVTLSDRLSTLDNNSEFLAPKNQGTSELVLSVVQPLLQGVGYHYNLSKIKIAKLDAKMAASEFLRQLQAHLLEVNRAYWSIYLARASLLLKEQLVADTAEILADLEERTDLDAVESEVLRARAALAHRKSLLIRAEMAIRNSEERLRAMVNDPDFDIGSRVELIPTSRPVFTRHLGGVQEVALLALHNRPEIQQSFEQLRAALIRRDMQKNERLPELNLVAEVFLGEIKPNENYTGAFRDQFDHGPGYAIGFSMSHPLGNDFDKARLQRREVELRQQANQLKTTIDTVLVEAVVAYRELVTAYRDMQGKHQTLLASRQELRRLEERLGVDSDEAQTISYQLQLILDSMERNQGAEEDFLGALVSYNTAFAALERAQGTFLHYQDVRIDRIENSDDTHPNRDMEMLELTLPMDPGPSEKGGVTVDASAVTVPDAAKSRKGLLKRITSRR